MNALYPFQAEEVIFPDTLEFELPPELEATEPPEVRGLSRDEVRLLISYPNGRLVHTHFRGLPGFLKPGDVLVINTSGTMSAALQARRENGAPVEMRLSTHLPGGLWVVELRVPSGNSMEPFLGAKAGELLNLAGGATATLHAPYAHDNIVQSDRPTRLWISTLSLPESLEEYLERHGSPIRYGYVKESWPQDYYQTVYATETGSAEMPSAGRAFTPELITRLVAGGVQIAPLILHTGIASLEADELPYEEFYRVPPATARLVNAAHETGGRVVAVGTTVVRALETVTDGAGIAHPGEGWTNLFITPERGIRSAGALLTGLHEPRSTHLAMLEALAGREHLDAAYTGALSEKYLWHEFGDLHLILR